jgi:hypothetical protein
MNPRIEICIIKTNSENKQTNGICARSIERAECNVVYKAMDWDTGEKDKTSLQFSKAVLDGVATNIFHLRRTRSPKWGCD